MKSLIRVGLFFCAAIMLSACAYTPQQAVLRPQVTVAEEGVGTGVSVGVKVMDERPDKSLGHRGAAFMKGAKISTDQDVAGVVHEAIAEGLRKKGFNPLPFDDQQEKSLKIEIRLIEYSTSTGFWTGGIHTKAAMKAFAYSGGKTYENFYRTEDEERVVFVPDADANEKMLNQTISNVLDKLFQDQKLLVFLVK